MKKGKMPPRISRLVLPLMRIFLENGNRGISWRDMRQRLIESDQDKRDLNILKICRHVKSSLGIRIVSRKEDKTEIFYVDEDTSDVLGTCHPPNGTKGHEEATSSTRIDYNDEFWRRMNEEERDNIEEEENEQEDLSETYKDLEHMEHMERKRKRNEKKRQPEVGTEVGTELLVSFNFIYFKNN